MIAKQLMFGHDARKKMLEGVDTLEKAVITTLGPRGKCVLINDGGLVPLVTKDGVTVAKKIALSDPYKQAGVEIVQDVANRTNSTAGDGTTTATLLSSELIKAGFDLVTIGLDPNDIRAGMMRAKDDVIAELEGMKKTISSENEIFNIARISANNDSEIAQHIKEAFAGIGDGGIVNILTANNRLGKTSVDFAEGFQFDKGYTSSLEANQEDGSCVMNEPFVLVAENLPNSFEDIIGIFQYAKSKNRPLVIITDDFKDVLHTEILTSIKNGNEIATVLAPGMNRDTIADNLTDIAVATGATILGRKGLDISMFNPGKHLGTAQMITIRAKKTVISGGGTTPEAIEKHVEDLKKAIDKQFTDEAISELTAEQLKMRVARLTGGVANIRVGALTKIELEEKLARYEDAVNAVRAAISDGIIPGGGTALLKTSYKLYDKINQDKFMDAELMGYKAVLDTIQKPAQFIIRSTRERRVEITMEKVGTDQRPTSGFNAKTEEFCDDLFDAGVIDPIKVTKTALGYAVSAASTFITTECVITDEQRNYSLQAADETLMREDYY